MSFLKRLIGGVAMVAAPFLAAPIAGAIGVSSVVGKSLIGAGVGALGARVAGVDPMIGAGVGGLGAFGVAGGFGAGAGGLFGTTAAAPGAAATQGAVTGLAPAATGGAASGGFLGSLGANAGQALVQMALSTFGKAPQDLTEQERRALAEQARRQGIEENVFNQAFEQARMVAQRATPDVEGAFARTQMASQRQFDEGIRGATSGQREAARRRAALGGTLAGAAGTAMEQSRADSAAGQAVSAFAGLRPPSQSAAEQSLSIYGDLYKRRQDYASELARGAGTMFGGTG
jgi:hypothetical protein